MSPPSPASTPTPTLTVIMNALPTDSSVAVFEQHAPAELTTQPENAAATTSTEGRYRGFENICQEMHDMVIDELIPKCRIIRVDLPAKSSLIHTSKDGVVTECAGFAEMASLRPEGNTEPFSSFTESHVFNSGIQVSMTDGALLRVNKACRESALKKWPFHLRIPGQDRNKEIRFGAQDAFQFNDLSNLTNEVDIAKSFGINYESLLYDVHTLCVNININDRNPGIEACYIGWLLRACRRGEKKPSLTIKKIIVVCNETNMKIDDLDDFTSGPFQLQNITLDQYKLWKFASLVGAKMTRTISIIYSQLGANTGDIPEDTPVIEIVARGWPVERPVEEGSKQNVTAARQLYLPDVVPLAVFDLKLLEESSEIMSNIVEMHQKLREIQSHEAGEATEGVGR